MEYHGAPATGGEEGDGVGRVAVFNPGAATLVRPTLSFKI